MKLGIDLFPRVRQKKHLVVLFVILALALIACAWDANGLFIPSDLVEVAYTVTHTFPANSSSLTYSHGITTLALASAAMALAGIAGISMTEFLWNLPFVLIGAVTILLAFLMASRLMNRTAGLWSAAFIAALPVHV